MPVTRRDLYNRLDAARQALVDIVNEAFDALPPDDAVRIGEQLGHDGLAIGEWCKVVAQNVRRYGPDSAPRNDEREAITNVVLAAGNIAKRVEDMSISADLVRDAIEKLRDVERIAASIALILQGVPEPDVVRSHNVDGSDGDMPGGIV